MHSIVEVEAFVRRRAGVTPVVDRGAALRNQVHGRCLAGEGPLERPRGIIDDFAAFFIALLAGAGSNGAGLGARGHKMGTVPPSLCPLTRPRGRPGF